MINILRWIILLPLAVPIQLICYLLAPLVAFFVTKEIRFDVVKRYNKQKIAMPRDYLIKPLRYFQTHDNAVDEWWYGVYNVDYWFAFVRNWTQADYKKHAWIRYFCRVCWLWRNCAYGFMYAWFSRPKETNSKLYEFGTKTGGKTFWALLSMYPSSFQFECHIPLGWRYISTNIGWKPHKSMPNLLYATRPIGFRKVEK